MVIQIASLQGSDESKVKGKGVVKIANMKDALHAGNFQIEIDVAFNPAAQPYPTGNIEILVNLSDSAKGVVHSTSIDQVNSFGKHGPTAVITGRCDMKVDAPTPELIKGQFWMLIADNLKQPGQGTHDVVSFVVLDRNGARVAYGTGPLEKGDIEIAAK